MKSLVIVILFLVSFTLNAQVSATVMAVHDGDSFKVKLDSTNQVIWIRLSDVDAPEVLSNYVSADQPHGKEIGFAMRKMLKGQKVTLDTLYRDKYKRMVANVYLNGASVSKYMVENGYAWYTPYGTSNPEMVKAFKFAKRKKLQIWNGLGDKPIRPSTFRLTHKWPKKN